MLEHAEYGDLTSGAKKRRAIEAARRVSVGGRVMTDIVERLRLLQKHHQDNDAGEAADEIERLRSALQAREAQVFERNAVIMNIYNACDYYLRSGKSIEVEQ